MLLKGQAARLLAIVLCTLPLNVTAQTYDDLIVISQGSDDYVFQLDPEKFYSIPEVYVQEIRDFIKTHKEELDALGQSNVVD